MTKKRSFILLLLFLLAASFPVAEDMCLALDKDYAVIVNGEIIPMERFKRAAEAGKRDFVDQRKELSSLEADISISTEEAEMIEAAVLSQLIDAALIARGAVKEGIKITESEIRDKIEEMKKGFPSSYEFHRSVAEQKMTINDLKANITRQLTIDKIKEKLKDDIVVMDEEIAEFYDKNIDIFIQKEKIRLSAILVADRQSAEAVLQDLDAGEDFADLARRVSLDFSTKDLGGDIGYVEKGEIDGALAEIAFMLRPGHISPIIETRDGYYLVKVEDRIPAKHTTIEKARPSIERFLLDEKAAGEFNKWLDRLKFDADIELNEELRSIFYK